jgi:leucyl aminopeptidase
MTQPRRAHDVAQDAGKMAVQFDAFSGSLTNQPGECLIIGAYEHGVLGPQGEAVNRVQRQALARLLKRGDFSGRIGETLLLPEAQGLRAKRLLLVGLGALSGYNRRVWRRALTSAVQALLRTRIATAVIAIEAPAATEVSPHYRGRLLAEIVGAGVYRINDLKTAKRPRAAALARVKLGPVDRSQLSAVRRGLADGQAVAASSALLRDLANLPGNLCTPRHLANTAVQVGKRHRSVRVRVLNAAQIRRLNMGCFLAVTRGSDEPPRFIVMQYRGARRRAAAPIVLVGKGITFDTGGISLKDPAGMDEMKFDMCGGATVIAALNLAAELRLAINLVGLVPACENMPDGRATKPGDIIRSADGQTVEVLNTDAEGRLILCDALHYARRFKPAAVIDIATLTGACVIALGHHHSAVMANDDALARELVEAGVRADDRAWQLPLTEEYGEQLRSNFADLANVGGRDGGAITAAAFLAKYTRGLSWAHLDIAGTAWLSGAAKSATARPLPLLADFLIERARR